LRLAVAIGAGGLPAQRQVGEEAADAGNGLPPALPAWVELVYVPKPADVQLGCRHAVAGPVVAFAQPSVMQYRDRGLPEGDGGCLGRTGQVGAEYGGDPVVLAASSQLPGLRLALGGELAGQPARGTPCSLSTVVGWVSNTTSMATSQPYRSSGRAPYYVAS
jgi:hypothetical protein